MARIGYEGGVLHPAGRLPFALTCAALIALGSFASVRLHTVFDKSAVWERDVRGRYQGVLDALPPGGSVLYVYDLPPPEAPRHLQAQYAVAPRLLVEEGPAAAVLAEASSPAGVEAIATRLRLRVARRSPDGRVAVLLP